MIVSEEEWLKAAAHSLANRYLVNRDPCLKLYREFTVPETALRSFWVGRKLCQLGSVLSDDGTKALALILDGLGELRFEVERDDRISLLEALAERLSSREGRPAALAAASLRACL